MLSGTASLQYAPSQAHGSSETSMAGLTIHPEIYIVNDQQFDLAHGVTGGSGTELDPYVIQGWEMDASTTSTAGIDIRYTSVYFVIRDVYVHGVTDGIDFLYVVHGTIENTTTANNFNGITLSSSVADVIANNTVSSNKEGITIDNSQYVDCYNNTVVGTSSQGITLGGYSTSHVNVTGNQLRGNSWALVVTGVKNSTVSGNQIFSNTLGMDLEANNNVSVFENSFAADGQWIASHFTDILHVYHNNFFSLTNNPGIYIDASGSSWDLGYPGGGNYWSNYNGVDNCSGPGQNVCPQPDGIGDTPYQIDLLDQDNYPLMKPFGAQPRFAPTWPAGSELTASDITPTTVTLNWTPAIGAIKYRVYEYPVPITDVSSTSFTMTGLRIGATYSFKVEAGDGWSNFTTNGPGLTVRIIPPGAYLGYVAFYFGSNYQGGSTLIVNNFTDLGQNAVRVTSVTMTGELGSFSLGGLPLYLNSGETRTANMTIQIPIQAKPGNRTVAIAVTWQYRSLTNSTWTDAPTISIAGYLPVQASQPPPQSQGPNTGKTSPGFVYLDPSDWLISMINQYLLPAGATLWMLSFLGLALVLRKKTATISGFPRFCSRCGTEVEFANRFCSKCGTLLPSTGG